MQSRKESFIGLASENDLRIALHYEGAFKILYESDKYQDEIVMPALFMVRQFLELGLKYNIKKLKDISGSSNLVNKLSETHDLSKLYSSFLEHYKCAKKTQYLKDDNLLKDLELLVKHILVFDHDSMGTRYSEDKNGTKMIDISEICSLEEINKLLESASVLFCANEDIFGLIDDATA